ncbi:MAG: class I SAM-dependent methyltransferase [Thermomicrobiales bacterium]
MSRYLPDYGGTVETKCRVAEMPESLARNLEIDRGERRERRDELPATYNPAYFARLYAIEDRHFWFRARNRVIASIVGQVVSPFARGYRVLDIGCGTGVVLKVLQATCRNGSVVGIDPFPEALEFARTRTTCDLIVGDADNPHVSGQVEVIGMFDVLEHLEDDTGVLRSLHNRLSPGGALVLTVPAGPELWSYFDEASHHQRRYTRSSLSDVLSDAGFTIDYISHFMLVLYPLMWLSRRLAHRLTCENRSAAGRPDALAMRELRIVPGLNDALAWLLGQESRLVRRRHSLPFGTSLLVVARVPTVQRDG